MSTLTLARVDCAGCGAAVEGELVVMANLGARADLRAGLFTREINVLRCAACGRTAQVQRTSAFMDFRRHQWIVAYPDWAERHWAELAAATALSVTRNLGLAAPAKLRAEAPRWTVRVVFGLEAAREKLVIWDAGLDDLAVERLKLVVLAGQPRWLLGRAWVDAVDADSLRLRLVAPDGAEGALTLPLASLPTGPIPGVDELGLGLDPFVSARRVSVRPEPADPLSFDLDGRAHGHRNGEELRHVPHEG
ncbi:CpXC domain-containing protein [Myxococcota bacterium]|nr:CpXC domain-containing protein [Myxococcota bacterium]